MFRIRKITSDNRTSRLFEQLSTGPKIALLSGVYCTVKSRFKESRFNVKSQFKVQNLATKMEFHIKKSRFSVKSQFKESNCADRGHSLNQDFIVLLE